MLGNTSDYLTCLQQAAGVAVCYNGQNEHRAIIMLRTTIFGFTLLAAGLALAQAPATPSSAPPQQKLEPVEDSETPITGKPKPQPPRGRVKEKTRQTERGTETEVDTGRTTYTVKQQTPPGQPTGDVKGTTTFKVLEFDLNRKKKPTDKGAASAEAAAAEGAEKASVPPPPPMQPTSK
jgi:hypothetical protein